VRTTATPRQWIKRAAAVVALGLVATACGGGDDGDGGGGGGGSDEDAGTPTPGGTVIYGLEAETADGWCLPESQLAISGIMNANAIYDTLTLPGPDGEVEPFLAESVEPNEDSTVWTITLREGITFHDGTDLTAEVVKNNLDAYRGTYPTRSPQLTVFVFEPIESIEVVDDLTVQVNLKQPWVSFDATLWGGGRYGIMAQAQLDDEQNCATNLIGTGPFTFVDWVPNQRFQAEKYPDYWATDAAGNQLPYLDAIEFRPIPEIETRLNSLRSGEINAMHTSDADTIVELRTMSEGDEANMYESDAFGEVSYNMLNESQPPFDNIIARQALAYSYDFDRINEIINAGITTRATGPFAPGNIGNLEDSGYPAYDLDEATRLAQQYEDETGEPLSFTLSAQATQSVQRIAQLIKEMAEEAGISVEIVSVDQSALIDTALEGDFQMITWRNHPGGDPDLQYNWWKTGSPVNFGRFADEEIDSLLDQGRESLENRDQVYEDINRRFAEQVHNLWGWYTPWTVAMATDVNGVPGESPDSAEGFPGLASGHRVEYMWVEQ
jgi:peptide/nickel transport system substrate-binding protein